MTKFLQIHVALRWCLLFAALCVCAIGHACKIRFLWYSDNGYSYYVTVINNRDKSSWWNPSQFSEFIDESSSEVPLITNIEIKEGDPSKPHTIDFDKLYKSRDKSVFFYGEVTDKPFDIGADVFMNDTQLTGITLSSSLRNIGSGAFSGCTGLTDVDIPQSVSRIDSKAFAGCTGLKPVFHLAAGQYPTIADDAFGGALPMISENAAMKIWQGGIEYSMYPYTHKLEVDPLTDEVKSSKTDLTLVGSFIFNANIYADKMSLGKVFAAANSGESGAAMTGLTIGEGLVSISDGAFCGCDNLNSLTLPSTYKGKLTNTMFSTDATSTPSLDHYRIFVDGVPYNIERGAGYNVTFDKERTNLCKGEITLQRYLPFVYGSDDTKLLCGNIQDACVPAALFKGNTSITSVKLEPKVSSETEVVWHFESLGASCFEGCTALNFVSTTPYLHTFGEGCFRGCVKLNSLYIDHVSGSGKTEPLTFGGECFAGCTSLDKVSLPFNAGRTALVLGEGMFSGCTALTSVNLRAAVNKADGSAYHLPARCFEGCDKLQTLKFVSPVKDIAEGALGGKGALQTVESPVTIEKDDSKYDITFLFNYPQKTASMLSAPDGPSFFAIPEEVTLNQTEGITGTITYIADNCFSGNKSTKSIQLPSSVKVHVPSDGADRKTGVGLGTNCFNLDVLQSVTFTTDFNDNIIYEANRSTEDKSVMLVSLKDEASTKKCSVKDVHIPAYVVLSNITGYVHEIYNDVFSGNTDVESVTIDNPYKPIPDGITDKEAYGFDIFGKNVNNTYPFNNCTSMKTLVLPKRLTYISDAFNGCSALEKLELPAGSYILYNVFCNSTSLRKLSINEGITKLTGKSFSGCSSLRSVVLPASLQELNAFNDCSSLGAVVLLGVGFQNLGTSLSILASSNNNVKIYCKQKDYSSVSRNFKFDRLLAFQDYRILPDAQFSYATVCLPRSFSQSNSYGMWKILVPERMYDNYHMEFKAVSEVEAGRPCLIRRCGYSDPDYVADLNNLVVFGCDMSEKAVDAPLDDDVLVGTFTSMEAPTPCYLMQRDDLFHILTDNSTKKLKVGAYRAYMKANSNLSSNVAIMEFADGPTAVEAVENKQADSGKRMPIYNLNGQRVATPVKGHIYIVNGKKVMF